MTAEHKSVLTIPHDFDCEQAILGAVIYDNSNLDEIANILTPNSFHEESHRHIYRAMLELRDSGRPIDEIIIGDQLKEFGKLEDVGGYAYIAELESLVPMGGNIVYYAKIVQEHAVLRDFICVTSDLSRKARDPQQSVHELLSEATNKISEISEQTNQKKTVHIKDVVLDRVKAYEERKESKKDIVGIPTGFYDLDSIISGLIAPNMISVAADSSMGKSTFAFNIVENIYKKTQERRPTFIVSREMSSDEIGDKMLCSRAKINTSDFKIGKISQPKSDELYHKAGELTNANILINDYFHTFDQVANEARYLHRHSEGGLCFMVVDYLNLLEGVSKSNREQEIAYMSRNTKRLAKELNIPIMPLAQLNRDLRKRSDKRPIRSDLRESASIEHDSDILIFIYRDEFYNKDSDKKGIAEIIVDKHRNGPTGLVDLGFQGHYSRFTNLAKYDSQTYNPDYERQND